MPGRLISFILILVVIIIMAGFNLEYKSEIRFWFGDKGHLKEVPIVVSFSLMYLFGVISTIPFIVSWQWKLGKKRREKQEEDSSLDV